MSERLWSQVDVWRALLAAALRVVDGLPAVGCQVSNVINLFIDDAQAPGFLTPRLNDMAARLTGHYQESANALKLVLAEGDIDFILAGPVTREPVQDGLDFDGRRIPLEPVAEILAKKLLYRAPSLKPRDVFDLATALVHAPDAGRLAIAASRRVHPVLLRRLAALKTIDAAGLAANIETTADGRAHLDGMVDRVAKAIEQCE